MGPCALHVLDIQLASIATNATFLLIVLQIAGRFAQLSMASSAVRSGASDETMLKLPKSTTVKNKSAANRQVGLRTPPPSPNHRTLCSAALAALFSCCSATRLRDLRCCLFQITAEQILRESRDLQEKDFRAPSQLITNEAEQAEYRLRKRKEFEDTVRRIRWNLSVWQKVSNFSSVVPRPWETA